MAHLRVNSTVPLPAIQTWILHDTKVDFSILERKTDKEFTFDYHSIQAYIDGYHNYVQIYGSIKEFE